MTAIKTNKKVDMADIFIRYLPDYLKKYRLFPQEKKVAWNIMNCRTANCGTHRQTCSKCGHTSISYNSCCDRHCPQCRNGHKEDWLLARKSELLPVKYFHLVFTLPHSLNPLVLNNKDLLYGALFEASSQTITKFAGDTIQIGLKTGHIGMLHTWGQNLEFHPHIHYIVPGGGISDDGMEWVPVKKNFFAPVIEMSAFFRDCFLRLVENLYAKELLVSKLDKIQFEGLIAQHQKMDWVVFAQKSFSKPAHVVKYLANYTHRVAISNHRIEGIQNDKVQFKWKNYAANGTIKPMQLPAVEFIRRFLLHVLPKGFSKIRYFGFMSNRNKAASISQIREELSYAGRQLEDEIANMPQNWVEAYVRLTGKSPFACPKCGGTMELVAIERKFYHNTG